MGGHRRKRKNNARTKLRKEASIVREEFESATSAPVRATDCSPCGMRVRSSSLDSVGGSELRRRFGVTSLSDERPTSSSSSRKRRLSSTAGPRCKSPVLKRQPRIVIDENKMNTGQVVLSSCSEVSETKDKEQFVDDEDESDNESDEEEQPELEEDDYVGLENAEFARMRKVLNEETHVTCAPPPQLTDGACRGIGSPKKVWNLLVQRDAVSKPEKPSLEGSVSPKTRAVLVDWMMEVCGNEKQHRETFHLAVDYLDRYLAADPDLCVSRLQCIGTTAIFMASKYEEIYPPKLEHLVDYTDDACNDDQVREAELIMLSSLNWSLSATTAIHWLNIYLQLLGNKEVVPSDDKHLSEKSCIVPVYLREEYMNMSKVLDLAVLDVECRLFSYRELAAAVLFACYEPHGLVHQVTGFSYEELLKVIEWLEPCVRLCEKNRGPGDPLPHVDEVAAEEWHNIQTHHGYAFGDYVFRVMRDDREAYSKQISEGKTRLRPAPLRTRCRNEGTV